MKSVRNRLISFLTFCLLGMLIWSETAYAFQVDKVYTYNSKNEAVPSINAYQFQRTIDGRKEGFGILNNPQDIFVDKQDNLYILDSGNCRVVILNNCYELIRVLDHFSYQGKTVDLAKDARGIFFRESDQRLYITDTRNDRILVSDLYGRISKIYEKPVSPLLDANLSYAPQKIIVDNMGIMYVTSSNVNTGALLVDEENNFLGFYGTNEISGTLAVRMEYMIRSILTEEQNAILYASFQPTEFNNLFWSDDRFVYTVSPESEYLSSTVAKLDVVGNNILTGDLLFGDSRDEKADTNVLTDITADTNDFFTVIDGSSGKLFQYDDKCNLLCVFGGSGWQEGVFQTPVAIETNSKEHILVLDKTKANVSVMELTYYGSVLHEAVKLHNQGLYTEAMECWQEILKMNPNNFLGYVGMGKAYMEMGQYEQAMKYFQLGEDQENYGKAKTELREEWIRENFAFITAIVICLIVIIMCYDVLKKVIVTICKHGMLRKGRVK